MKQILAALSLLLFSSPALATTIAYDGHIMAADSQTVCGTRKWINKQKIHDMGTYYIAGAGIVTCINHFIDLCRTEGKEAAMQKIRKCSSPEDNKAMFLLVTKQTGQMSVIIVDGRLPVLEHFDRRVPYAIGSGCDFAMGAMKSGKNAMESVQVAVELDLYSGGTVQAVSIK